MRATASRLPHACIYGRYHRGYAVGVAQSTQSSHRLPPFELPPRGSSGVSWLPQGRGRHRSDFGLTAFIRPRLPLSQGFTTVQPRRGFVFGRSFVREPPPL
jgi:hypothetical protein